jgi:hypothetical protein
MKNPPFVAGGFQQETSAQFTGTAVAWSPARCHVAILRSASRPDSLVLLSLFPPKAAPGERRGWNAYHLTTTGKVLEVCPRLVKAIATDLATRSGYSLGVVVNEPLPQPIDWGSSPDHFSAPRVKDGQALSAAQQQAERERRAHAWNIGDPRACHPRQWGASIDHIGPCQWLFAECDRDGMGPADQLALAAAVFGVEPTFSVHTGGKSIHCYWRLAESVSPERFVVLQKLVFASYQHLDPGCSVDRSLAKPNQVMRLAGGPHPRTGEIASIHGASNTVIDADALEARLLELVPHPVPGAQRGPGLRRPQRVPLPSQRGPAPTMEQIRDALTQIPAFASGQGQRPEFVRFVGGLRGAVADTGGTEQQALDLALGHSPGVIDAEDYWRYDWTRISAGSLWHLAGGHPSKRQQVRP